MEATVMSVVFVLLAVLGLGFGAVSLVGFLEWRSRMRNDGLGSVG
jgi:hypothetical protein